MNAMHAGPLGTTVRNAAPHATIDKARPFAKARPLPLAMAACLAALLQLPAHLSAAHAAPNDDLVAREEIEKNLLREIYKDIPAAQAKGNQTCIIAVSNGGAIAPNPEATELSSRGFGGAPGKAEIFTSTGSFSLVADAPLGFAMAPTGGNDDVSFSVSISGFGVTSFSDQPGRIPVRLKNGQTSVEANLVAKRASGFFPSGHYRAELVLRCE